MCQRGCLKERKYFQLNENVCNVSEFVGCRWEGGAECKGDKGGNIPGDQVFKGRGKQISEELNL